jgi:Ca-activated chloride channel family protein
MPGDEIDVTLEYSELLVPEEGVYEFMYPTVVGPRYSTAKENTAPASEHWLKSPYTHEGVAPSSILDIRTTVAAGIPIDSLLSPSHKIVARWSSPAKAETTLAAGEEKGGDRDFILRYKLRGGEIQSGLILHEGEDENFFLLTVQPPKRVRLEAIPPREYVFVVDVSGSMNGFPLDTSKTLLRDLIGRLRPTDTFNVVFFSGGSQLFAPESVPATEQNIALALHMLGGQRGGGGTELLRALQRAMALPHKDGWSRNFIVITDGYISAEADAFRYIREHLDGANVYSFGIGSGVNRYLVEGIAKAGLGEPFVVIKPELAQKEAARLRKYVEAPVLTDVGVSFEGFDAYDVEPKAIPDVLADRPIVVFGKYRGKPRGAAVVRGVTGEGPYLKRISISKKEVDPDAAALAKLWARAKVANIADFNFGNKSEEQRAEIVALGLKYSLLTEFTSFIAVYEVVRNLQGAAEDVKQPLPLPKGVSDLAIGGVTVGAEPGLWALLLCLVALFGVRRRWARV